MSLLVIKPEESTSTDEAYIDSVLKRHAEKGWYDYYQLEGRFHELEVNGLTFKELTDSLKANLPDKFYTVCDRNRQIAHSEVWSGVRHLKDDEWDISFEKNFLKNCKPNDRFLVVDYHN